MQLGFYGSTTDPSGNNNNATLIGAPSYTTGVLPTAQALSLNGTSQYSVIPYSSSLNLTGAYTVSLWEKGALTGSSTTASAGGAALFSTRNNSNFDFDLQINNGGLHAETANPALATQGALPFLHFAPKAKRVIYLFMSGAPSHIDLYDNKPKLKELAGSEDLSRYVL